MGRSVHEQPLMRDCYLLLCYETFERDLRSKPIYYTRTLLIEAFNHQTQRQPC